MRSAGRFAHSYRSIVICATLMMNSCMTGMSASQPGHGRRGLSDLMGDAFPAMGCGRSGDRHGDAAVLQGRWRGSERLGAGVRQLCRPQMRGSSPQKLSTPVGNVDSGVDRSACRSRFERESPRCEVWSESGGGVEKFFSTVLHTTKPQVTGGFGRIDLRSPQRCPQSVHATRRVLHTLSTRAVGNAVARVPGRA